MKYLFVSLLLITSNLKAQTILNFDKRFVECEDKWVVFNKRDTSQTYAYGFIYIDAQAGLTFNYEGTFTISPNGTFIPKKIDSASFKYRLTPNQVKVAIIPETKFKELQISEKPEWLKYYETDTTSIERLYRWGFLYNSWDECTKALTYLEKAEKINPQFEGLNTELAYAYNALEQYQKAIDILNATANSNTMGWYFYKELSYAEMNLGQLDKASDACKKGIEATNDKQMKSEIAYNIAYQYYKRKEKDNFKYWADETKKWATPNDRFMNGITAMEGDLYK
jgi:tetratricopeptide (TPR) repeat protein